MQFLLCMNIVQYCCPLENVRWLRFKSLEKSLLLSHRWEQDYVITCQFNVLLRDLQFGDTCIAILHTPIY